MPKEFALDEERLKKAFARVQDWEQRQSELRDPLSEDDIIMLSLKIYALIESWERNVTLSTAWKSAKAINDFGDVVRVEIFEFIPMFLEWWSNNYIPAIQARARKVMNARYAEFEASVDANERKTPSRPN